jgi:hypothetical protein
MRVSSRFPVEGRQGRPGEGGTPRPGDPAIAGLYRHFHPSTCLPGTFREAHLVPRLPNFSRGDFPMLGYECGPALGRGCRKEDFLSEYVPSNPGTAF